MNVQCHACIGGKSIGEDIRRLDYGVQVVSGTPGRVFDMVSCFFLNSFSIFSSLYTTYDRISPTPIDSTKKSPHPQYQDVGDRRSR